MVVAHDIGKDFCVEGASLSGLKGLAVPAFHRIRSNWPRRRVLK